MRCPFCSTGCTIQVGASCRIYTCKDCKHKFRPYKETIAFHENQYRKQACAQRVEGEYDAEGRVTQRFHDARLDINRARREIIRSYLKETYWLLDIGSGAGSFALEVAPLVDVVHCLELDKRLVDESERLGFITWNDDFLSADVSRTGYDIITNWHVLEHVEDPAKILERVCDLNPITFICEVPTKRRLKQRFDGHIHMFTKESLTRLFNRFFEDVEIQEGIQKPSLLVIAKGPKRER